MGFLAELQRRRVIRVGAAYLIVAWLVLQVVNNIAQPLSLPPWTARLVIVLLGVGLVVALAVAWAFELTPEGLKRAEPLPDGGRPSRPAATDVVLAVAVVALLGVSVVQIARPRALSAPAATSPSGAALSIAVLPFADMSPEGDQEYFSDGLSEELLNTLSRIPVLRVAGRTSSFAFKGRETDLRDIGAELGVAHILEGSVRKSGDRLRITAQLINAADGYHLWSQTYERRLDDVFAVQEEIARPVADALSITLGVDGSPGAATARTADVEVYDLYLRGLDFMRNATGPRDFIRAADAFRGVLAFDPMFARAYAVLASTFVPVVVLFPERAAQTTTELEEDVARALASVPDAPEAHFANAILQFQRRNWREAEAAFARAGGYGAAVDTIPYPAVLQLTLGRARRAAEALSILARNDPLAPDATTWLQQALTIAGLRDEAEAEYRRATTLARVAPPTEHMALMRAWNGGDDALIRERFDRYIRTQTVTLPLDAQVREVYDDPVRALELVREAAARPEMQDATRQVLIAIYAGHYGDPDLVVTALRRALRDRNGLLHHALWFPDMVAARRTGAFKALVRDLGLVDYWRAAGDWGDFCRPLGADDFECR